MNWLSDQCDDAIKVTVNAMSSKDFLDDIQERMASDFGYNVATLNLDHVVKLRQSPEFRRAYDRMTHITADGRPIVWLSRIAGTRVELLPGSDLISPLADLAAQHDVPVGLFGSNQKTLEDASNVLVAHYPKLNIVARIAPSMTFDPFGSEADAAIDAFARLGAKLCFVALGAPKQEIFATRAHNRLPNTGFISIGAGLDFIAGTQVRAPQFVRVLHGEWVWRSLSNPRRLGPRYIRCLTILPGLIWKASTVRLGLRS